MKHELKKIVSIYQSLVVVASIEHLPVAKAAVEYALFILETKHFHTFLC